MNKNIIYIGVALIVGLLGGYLIFGGGSADTATNKVKDDHNHSEEIASGQMWTCSMHPQIMQPEPGDCPICGMDLIPAEAGAVTNKYKLLNTFRWSYTPNNLGKQALNAVNAPNNKISRSSLLLDGCTTCCKNVGMLL